MFLKKKLKIYLIMLSVLSISAPINAMKKNEINENIIKTNEIKNENFEEENSECNIKINIINNNLNEIKKKIEIMKEQDFENLNINNYVYNINELQNLRQDLLNLKEGTKNKETINTINDISYEINKIIDTLTITKIKKDIIEIKENLKDINKNRIINLINYFNFHKKNLLTIKEKTNDKETINAIDDVSDEINKIIDTLTITKIKKEINEIKEQDFENLNINNYVYNINELQNLRQDLLNLKEKTNNKETVNTINDALDEIDEFVIKTVKLKIQRIKKQDSKKIYIDNVQQYHQYKDILNFYVGYLLNLKKETKNKVFINTVNNILNEVNILIITKIKKEINEIKEKNTENIDEDDIFYYIGDLNNYKQELLTLKKQINNKKTINIINDILKNIEKITNNLIINEIKIKINKANEQNSENIDAYNFFYYINDLKSYKQDLLNLKKETKNKMTINSINSLLNDIKKLIIKKIAKEIVNIKESLNNVDIDEINYYVGNSINYKEELLNLKKETNFKKTIDSINNELNNINKLNDELNIKKIKLHTKEIEKNLENIYINNFGCYINDLNSYKQKLLTLKEETNNEETKNFINNTLDNINNLSDEIFTKIFKIYMKNSKIQDSKNIYINNTEEYQKYVNTLKFYKEELLNLKKETNNEETTDNINDILNDIDESIIKAVKLEVDKLEKEYLKKNCEYEKSESLSNVNEEPLNDKIILNQNNKQKNNSLENLNIKKSNSATNIKTIFKITK